MQFELSLAHRLVQLALEPHPVLGGGAHALGVALHVVATALLGGVHGGIGARQQRIDRRTIAGVERNADARGDVHVDPEEPHRGPHRVDRALADADGFRARHGSIDQDHELIAPETCRGVDRAHRVLQALRHLAQQIIAGAMPEGVIDELEAVEVDHQQCELVGLAVCLGDGLSDAIIQQQAVRQSGEGIVRRQMTQLAVGGFQPAGAVGDGALETLDVMFQRAGVLPLAAERARRLQYFDRLERLLDDDEFVGMPEPG